MFGVSRWGPCAREADEPQQKFQLSEGQFLDKSSMCLTAPGPPAPAPIATHVAMGRPLSGDDDGGAADAAALIQGAGCIHVRVCQTRRTPNRAE